MLSLTRQTIIQTIHDHLAPLPYVHALWEAGSAAFDRIDAYSDIDLQVIVADDSVEATFTAIQTTLSYLCEISRQFRVPEPTWHGHSQTFYTLADAPEFLLIDFAVMKASAQDHFLQREIHGEPRILFDKTGATTPPPFDHDALTTTLSQAFGATTSRFWFLQPYVRKEILRGNILNAMHFYPSMTLAPLVTLLRIKYDPTRYSWGQRYLSYYLPETATEKLADLNLIRDLDDLATKHTIAQEWFRELETELKERLKGKG